MPSLSLFKRMGVDTIAVGLIGVCAVFFFATTLAHALWTSPVEDQEVPSPSVAAAHAGVASPSEYPSRLIIPSLNVNAYVQKVGKAKSGNMAVPSNYSDVAWYRLGTVPGFEGNAVMDGHVDNGFGLPGVFKNVSQLRKGDDVYVETHGGTRLHFKVVEVATYPYQQVPRERVFNQHAPGEAQLNLITCEGNWLSGQKTYDHRLVVYTKLVE